jgi:hypothetical protein
MEMGHEGGFQRDGSTATGSSQLWRSGLRQLSDPALRGKSRKAVGTPPQHPALSPNMVSACSRFPTR